MYNLVTENRIMLFTSCLLFLPRSHRLQSYEIQVWVSQDFMYFPPSSLFPCKLLCSDPHRPYLTLFKIVTHKSSTKPNVIYPNSDCTKFSPLTHGGVEVNWSFFSTHLHYIALSHTLQIEFQINLQL